VPAAGPDDGLRPGREPLRRGEAALREADRISDNVYLDRERCILCDRCTRFADEVAGDPLIHFVSRGNTPQVNTFPDEPVRLVLLGQHRADLPGRALTAKPYRFKARPWDLAEAESTCTTCSVGCRIIVQSSPDEVLRFQGVDSDPVNWGWLCDKGRFGFEALKHDRIERPRSAAMVVWRRGTLVGGLLGRCDRRSELRSIPTARGRSGSSAVRV
jgi:NADH dehydrogenase/NADH:ubiquinone oxidoreductase subunit G